MGAATALLASVLVAVNVTVDSFDVFALVRGKMVNVRLATALRMAKAYAIHTYRPDCLVLGSSRAEVGIRPAHGGWSCDRPYNSGLPAGQIYEARRYLEHAIAQGPVKQVLLGLDLEIFRTDGRHRGDFMEARLAHNSKARWSSYPVNELLGLALGADALLKSIDMLRNPVEVYALELSGERSTAWWEHESAGRSVRDLSADLLQGVATQIGKPGALAPGLDDRLPSLEELERIIELCREHGIELRLAINPTHVLLHATMADIGQQGTFLKWKRAIVQIAARAHSRGADVLLWDFALLNDLTTEPVPKVADRSQLMHWFWEPSHFRTAYGNLMVETIYSNRPTPVEIAVRPDVATISESERVYRVEFERWMHNHPAEIAAVKNWLAPTRKKYGIESGIENWHTENVNPGD
ncbi:MAG: hypothetical protein AABY95_04165 [Pseudomonadota bacterium]